MAIYNTSNSLTGTQPATTSTYVSQTILKAATATLTRAIIQELDVGAIGTPADNAMEYDVSRQTADGTATAAVPVPLDTTSRAAGTVGAVNATAEGTVTATSSVFYIALNQRATFRWVAAPGSELVIPATNLAGFTLRARSGTGYTGKVAASMLHIE